MEDTSVERIYGLVTGGVRHPSLWGSVGRAKKAVERFIMEDWGPDNFKSRREKFVWSKPELAWHVEVYEADGTWVSDFGFRVWALPLSEVSTDEWS